MAYANSPTGFKFEYSTVGGFPSLEEGKLDTNISVAAGDPLIRGDDGYLELALSTSPLIVGVAAHAVTGAASVRPDCRYYPAVETNVFSIQGDGNMTQGYIGTYRSINGTTGAYALDSTDADPGVLNIIGFKRGYTAGTYAHMLIVFKKSQFSGQS